MHKGNTYSTGLENVEDLAITEFVDKMNFGIREYSVYISLRVLYYWSYKIGICSFIEL